MGVVAAIGNYILPCTAQPRRRPRGGKGVGQGSWKNWKLRGGRRAGRNGAPDILKDMLFWKIAPGQDRKESRKAAKRQARQIARATRKAGKETQSLIDVGQKALRKFLDNKAKDDDVSIKSIMDVVKKQNDQANSKNMWTVQSKAARMTEHLEGGAAMTAFNMAIGEALLNLNGNGGALPGDLERMLPIGVKVLTEENGKGETTEVWNAGKNGISLSLKNRLGQKYSLINKDTQIQKAKSNTECTTSCYKGCKEGAFVNKLQELGLIVYDSDKGVWVYNRDKVDEMRWTAKEGTFVKKPRNAITGSQFAKIVGNLNDTKDHTFITTYYDKNLTATAQAEIENGNYCFECQKVCTLECSSGEATTYFGNTNAQGQGVYSGVNAQGANAAIGPRTGGKRNWKNQLKGYGDGKTVDRSATKGGSFNWGIKYPMDSQYNPLP